MWSIVRSSCTFALAALALALIAPSSAAANVPREVGPATLVGEARFSLLGLALFDAALYAQDARFSWERGFALSLTYRRAASRDVLLNRTVREMSQRGAGGAETLAPLRARLAECFADVRRGDRITGVSTGADSARFYFNGVQRCDVRWPGFRRAFFGIWLDASGHQAALSARLRGEG